MYLYIYVYTDLFSRSGKIDSKGSIKTQTSKLNYKCHPENVIKKLISRNDKTDG